MTLSLFVASYRVVRSGLLVPVIAACALVGGTAHLFDDGYAAQVLRGVGVLLACARVATQDDPMGEVIGGSPYPRWMRSLARAGVGFALVALLWVGTVLLAQWRGGDLPVLPLALEAVGLGLSGVTAAAVLRAGADRHQPSYVVIPGVVALAVAINSLPRGWAMVPFQTWGPPWEAAQLRWTALALLCLGLLAGALRDPLADRPDAVPRSGDDASYPRRELPALTG